MTGVMTEAEIDDMIGLPVALHSDLAETNRFLEVMAQGERVTFQTFDDTPAKRPKLARTLHGTLDEHATLLGELNAKGAGVFVTVNATDGGGRKRENVTRVRALFADFDDPAPDTRERLRADDLPPSIIVESSPGKLHAYWQADGLELTEFTALQKRVATAWGSDPSVNDLPRVLRLPGFLHNKGEPQPVRLIETSGKRYGAEELRARYSTSTASESTTADDDDTDDLLALLPTRVDLTATFQSLADGVNVHENARDLVGRLLHYGTPEAAVRALFTGAIAPAVAAARGQDRAAELTGSELDRMIEGAKAKGFAPAAGTHAFSFVQASDMVVKPVSWLVRGYFEADTLAVLYGPPGKGKSFLALDICCCVAAGVPFHGHEVEQGAVFYIAGEGHNGIARRLRAWANHHELADTPQALFVSSAPVDLANAINATRVSEAVERLAMETGLSPALIVVDTMARNFLGDENSSQDVGRFVANIDAMRRPWKATVLVVHHTGKDTDRGARGSSALKAAVDAEFEVSRRDDDKLVNLTTRKMKDADAPPPLAFNLASMAVTDSDGGITSSAVLTLTDYMEPFELDAGGLGKNQTLALDLLEGMPPPRSEKAWRDKCSEAGMVRQRYHEARHTLEARGLIAVRGKEVLINREMPEIEI